MKIILWFASLVLLAGGSGTLVMIGTIAGSTPSYAVDSRYGVLTFLMICSVVSFAACLGTTFIASRRQS